MVVICRSRQLLFNLTSPYSACCFLFPSLGFFGSLISEADLLVGIRLDELKSFPAGLKEYVVKFCECRACVQLLEQLPLIDRYHIDHQGGYFSIYHEEGYDYRKGVVIDMFKLLCHIIPKGRPHLFLVISYFKV